MLQVSPHHHFILGMEVIDVSCSVEEFIQTGESPTTMNHGRLQCATHSHSHEEGLQKECAIALIGDKHNSYLQVL